MECQASRCTVPECAANATDDVVDNARERPDHPSFARLVDGEWRTVSAKEFADEVEALAAGLIAAGIAAGDRVALLSSTRYESSEPPA